MSIEVSHQLLPTMQAKVTPKQIVANRILAMSSVELQQAISEELDENPALGSQCPTAQACPSAARQKRDLIFIRDADDLGNLLGGCGKYNDVRLVLEEREAVAFVDEKLRIVIDNGCAAKNLAQLAYNLLLHGFAGCSLSFLICSFTNAACG